MIVHRLELRRRHIAERAQQPVVVEPVDPRQGRRLDGADVPPSTARPEDDAAEAAGGRRRENRRDRLEPSRGRRGPVAAAGTRTTAGEQSQNERRSPLWLRSSRHW